MKRFLIKYTNRLGADTAPQWHAQVAAFIAAVNDDPALRGKVSYRCLKAKDSANYYHLAQVLDDETVKTLQQRPFFQRYTEETKRVGGGAVDVVPLETIAETEPLV